MKYRTLSFLWIPRFSFGAEYSLREIPDTHLREADLYRLRPWSHVSWRDRFSGIFFLTGASIVLFLFSYVF